MQCRLLAFLLPCSPPAPLSADDRPQWRGLKRAGAWGETGDDPKLLWQGKRLSLLMSTPIARDGHAYALDKDKGLKCIELKTGKVKWDGEFVTPRGHNPQASLVWAGQYALIFNELGELIQARLSPDGFREVTKTSILRDGTWANPAYADGCIFARNDKEIVCVALCAKTR